MSARPALAVALVALAVASSGCIWSPCGKTHATSRSWTSPDLFEAFPAPGEVGGYRVEHGYEHPYVPEKGGDWTPPPDFDQGALVQKQAFPLGREWPRLGVGRDGDANWLMYTRSEVSDGTAEREFAATFEALGLPLSLAGGAFHRFKDGMC